MGGGSWTASTYAASTGAKMRSGTSFSYTKSTASTKPKSAWTAHADLDPKKLSGAGSPFAGKNIRESRDSVEHPLSVPIATIFDCTGSMGSVPRKIQEKLAGLFGALLRKGYVQDPQIMIGAYGDAYCDSVPLQISQFESDNRIDDALDNLFLEGGGGGNSGETMSLAWYFLAHHTATDAWEKRGKKGYAFFIADEKVLPLEKHHIERFILPSDGEGGYIGEVAQDISVEGLAAALQEKWEAYVLVIPNYAAEIQKSVEFYRNLFGERCLVLDDPDAMMETIALTIGLMEGTTDLDAGADDLKALGSSDSAVRSASKALATVGAGSSGGSVVVSEAPVGLDDDDDEDSDVRL